jgi:primosomal protein N' (replication factor Y)
MFFIEVILPLALPKSFTYKVSEAEFHFLQIGMRVAVPFRKSKIFTGLVINKQNIAPQLYEAKEIHQILDQKPVVNSLQIEHWQWVASYYMCNLGDVFRSAMPSAFLMESETVISLNKETTVQDSELTDNEFLVYQALQLQSTLKIEDVAVIIDKKNVLPLVYEMLHKNIIYLNEELQETYKPKLVRYIKLNDNYNSGDALKELLDNLKGAKQKELVLTYFQLTAQEKKPVSAKQLLLQSQSTTATLKKMIEKEIFEEYNIQEDRVNFQKNQTDAAFNLSQSQQKAFQEIKNQWIDKEVCLLHGVTASGKTEIYIKIIEEHINQQKQVLYLLPEIALTTQLVSRLTKYFGNKVAVFHSKYSNNERVEVWNNVLHNSPDAQIVIGARSALFLPFSNLGLLIIDEEHEASFKQNEPAPRYHTRDSAIVLAHSHQAKVLLGSATPSIETYYNTQIEKFGLVTLTERFNKTALPEVVLVDLKDNYFRKKMTGHFSQTLLDAIAEKLSLGEQVILFQNRRGFSPIIECLSCGHVPQCQHCDVSLTYHKFKNQLRCHYCGYTIAKPTHCHACSSVDITAKGFGTEQIEIELASLFSTANIKRMDQDTTRAKYGYEQLIDSFKNREIDILVGTQMLAKGLDFDNVSLVGIMNADNMLYHPDFRAFERSFQMITQVSGRAGRAHIQGKVIIQTFNPLHNIIQQVTNDDYLAMYKEQLYERKNFNYPPFTRLIKLTIKDRDFEKLQQGSMWLYQVLKQSLAITVLGPEEPAINKIRNEYIRTILIKIPQKTALTTTKKSIQKVLNSFETISQYKSIKVIVNVDFY